MKLRTIVPILVIIALIAAGAILFMYEDEVVDPDPDPDPDEELDDFEDLEEELNNIEQALESVLMELEDLELEEFTVEDDL